MKFIELADNYIDSVLSMKKPATQATVKGHINLLNNIFGIKEIGDIKYLDIQKFISNQAKKKSPKTVRNIWSSFRLLLVQAKKEGLITNIPEPILPKNIKNQQDWLTNTQMRSIIETTEEPKYKFLFYLLAETGIRIGEALALTFEDINLENKTIKISKSIYSGQVGSTKTGSSNRTLTISGKCCSLFQETFPVGVCQTSWIFQTNKGTPCWPGDILTKVLHPILGRVNIQPRGFHSFRRGNATIMAMLGVPEPIADYRQGHSTATGLTYGLYSQIQAVYLPDKDWVDKIAEVLK